LKIDADLYFNLLIWLQNTSNLIKLDSNFHLSAGWMIFLIKIQSKHTIIFSDSSAQKMLDLFSFMSLLKKNGELKVWICMSLPRNRSKMFAKHSDLLLLVLSLLIMVSMQKLDSRSWDQGIVMLCLSLNYTSLILIWPKEL